MIGKFLLIAAVVCISFAAEPEVDATLKKAIEKGLARTASINKNGQRRIDAAINEVSFKRKIIESKTAEFIQRAENTQADFEVTLSKVAEETRDTARKSDKPKSVFECIDRVEENANKNVESLTKKFQQDIERSERVKLENIDTYAKPLSEMQESLKGRFEKASAIIKDCKTPECVDIAINSLLGWLDLLFSEITRIRGQINTAINNFQRDANTFITNTNRQITRIQTSSISNVKLCLGNRAAFFGQH